MTRGRNYEKLARKIHEHYYEKVPTSARVRIALKPLRDLRQIVGVDQGIGPVNGMPAPAQAIPAHQTQFARREKRPPRAGKRLARIGLR